MTSLGYEVLALLLLVIGLTLIGTVAWVWAAPWLAILFGGACFILLGMWALGKALQQSYKL